MNIIILTAAYPPMTNSGALQVNDLAHGLAYDGHQSIVIFPDAKITNKISFVLNKNLLEIRVKYPEIRDQPKFLRAILELLMPYFL